MIRSGRVIISPESYREAMGNWQMNPLIIDLTLVIAYCLLSYYLSQIIRSFLCFC